MYDLILVIFSVFYIPYAIFTGRMHSGIWQRLGYFPWRDLASIIGERPIWVHAVSVGEVIASRPLLRAIRKEFPKKRILLSCITKTGASVARNIKDKDVFLFFPLDLYWIMKRFIRRINPSIFIMLETEIWPNAIQVLSERKTPILMVNGRISDSSFKRYRFIRPFLKGSLQKVTSFCMQSRENARRIEHLGAPSDKVKVTGNLKFDCFVKDDRGIAASDLLAEAGLKYGEELFIAGSTHKGEDESIIKVYKRLLKNHPGLNFLIAPRHLGSLNEIEAFMRANGLNPIKFSEARSSSGGGPRTLLLDTMGQLGRLYEIATLVFMGGSLVPRGGHNLLEPASFSKPVLFGPHMANFREMAKLFLDKEAAIMVRDEEDLFVTANRLLKNKDTAIEMGRRAADLIDEKRGAAARAVELIRSLLKEG